MRKIVEVSCASGEVCVRDSTSREDAAYAARDAEIALQESLEATRLATRTADLSTLASTSASDADRLAAAARLLAP